jgi:hypothetical protein
VSRQVTGYATVVEPDRPVLERDTITCFHCQRVIWVKPGTASTVYLIFDRVSWTWKEEAGAFCRTCMHPICLPCCDVGRCTPWERRLEVSESRDRLRRAAGV